MSTLTQFTTSASNVFIDLATYSELEGFLYGGPDAITYFVRAVGKSNWFSYIPINLRHYGTFDFGQRGISASVNRSGDYVLNTWFRFQIPRLVLNQGQQGNQIYGDATIRFTRNLGHNIFTRVYITFNELTVHEFDNNWLDFNYQFGLDASKRIGYRNMIGDVSAFTDAAGLNSNPLGTGGFLNVPLPFFFTDDSGDALAVAQLPFNDVKINYQLARLQDVLVVYPGTPAGGGQRPATLSDVVVFGTTTAPSIVQAQTWAHYAVVHNDERVKMGDAPRDILIRQVQIVQNAPFKDMTTRSSFDLRLSHAIDSLFWAAQNNSTAGEQSNYTTEPNYTGLDPLAASHLLYENTVRVSADIDYYALLAPYYAAPAIPDETGYHAYFYCLNFANLNPNGSTDYSKLANVSILHDPSTAATNAANTANPVDQNGNPIQGPGGVIFPQTFAHVIRARNLNIARYANGSLGLPVL